MSQQVPPDSGHDHPPPGAGRGPDPRGDEQPETLGYGGQAAEGRGAQPPVYEAPGSAPRPPDGAPAHSAPAYGAPDQGAPAYGAPDQGAPAYGAPAYGAPTYAGPGHPPYASTGHGPQGGNGLAIGALVVGVLAVLTFLSGPVAVVLGLVAIALGVLGRSRAKRGARYGGLAVAGLALGVLGLLLGGFMTFAYAALFGTPQLDSFTQCLDRAATEAELQQCQREFEESVDVPR